MNSEGKRIKHSPDNLPIIDELILENTETQKHLKVSEYSGKLRLLWVLQCLRRHSGFKTCEARNRTSPVLNPERSSFIHVSCETHHNQSDYR